VSSLLEVGTGFHPDLTGRENVFLNGTILGMSKKEIERKFDEIVAFAEVEKFLDTPVKRYSSGMYVRLAFAVAAHLEPEILIVDEVLAVGDAQFQKKCLGKMEDVSKNEGRTVLFVSHNMAAISSLTNKCILLNKGKVQKEGPTQNVIEHYLKDSNEFQAEGVIDLSSFPRPTNKVNLKQSKVIFSKAYCLDTKGQFRTQFLEEEPIEIKYEIEVRQPVSFLEIQNSINTLLDIRAFAVLSDFNDFTHGKIPDDDVSVLCMQIGEQNEQ
jgi:lipopolysaccharide transport system ATP-binding protein